MRRLRNAGLLLAGWMVMALGMYEITAKSPGLFGTALPGWRTTEQVERAVRWAPATGILPVDKLLHEGEEAATFYAMLATSGRRHQSR